MENTTIEKDDNVLFATKKDFLKIKKAPNCSFFYKERKGIDSVALVFIDKEKRKIGLTNETKPPFNERENVEMAFKKTALGGSLFDMVDTEEYLKMSFEEQLKVATETVTKEAKEESGYSIEDKDIKFIKRVVFDSMSNEYVWLFVVEVDMNTKGESFPQNRLEEMASNVWVDFKDFITEIEDGKSRAALFDYFISEGFLSFNI